MLDAGGDMDSQRMSNAPVYYAMVQIKFAPIEAMKKYVSEIQDMLRVSGYPIYKATESTELKFEVGFPDQAPVHQVITSTNWSLINEERTAGFILGNDYLTFHTTKYETRNEFVPEILKGLKVVCDVAKVGFITRIGLRYLDAVLPSDGENVSSYLDDGLRNVDLGMQQIQSINEMVFKTAPAPGHLEGVLIVRVFRASGKFGFPPGVDPAGLRVEPRFLNAPQSGEHAIIDTDHFIEENMTVDYDSINSQIRGLHADLHHGFKKVVSSYAIDKWK